MKRSPFALLLLLALCPIWLNAQYKVIRILNSSGKALENVRVSDSKHTFYSDARGLITVPISADTLAFSRLGYRDMRLTPHEIYLADYIVVMQTQDIEHPLIRVREMEYRSALPALDAQLIHPDTNAATMAGAELLLATSSFSSTDSKLLGERQTVSLLGSLSRHTLVMLDGLALNAAGEAFDFSKIPVSQIERIEIIKGNSSAYGGSAAIGGIVNIVSKAPNRAKRADLGMSGWMGSFAMQRQQYQFSLLHKAWALSAHYEHYQAENDFRYEAWWDQDSQYTRKHNAKTADKIFIKSSVQSDTQSLEYSLSQGSFLRELPGPINFLDLYDDSRMSGAHWYHSLKHQWQGQNLNNAAQAFHQSDGSSFQNLASSNAINPNHYSQAQINRGLQNSLSWIWQESSLQATAEYKEMHYKFTQYDVYNSGSTSVKGERDNLAFGLRAGQKYHFKWTDGNSQLSWRKDLYDDEQHDSWRAEQDISYQTAIKYSIGGTYGTAFTVPSLYDMYWIGDSETQGNPDLNSESSEGFSIRSALEHADWQLRAAYYFNEVQDLIQWRQIFLFGSSWKPFNVGTAKISNYEAEGMWQVSKHLSLKGSLTINEAKDYSINEDGSPSATFDKYLTYTPKRKVQLSAKIADEKQSLTAHWTYTGEQYSTADNLIDPLKGFANLDLELMRKFTIKNLSITLEARLNNILNKHYEIYAYIPQPGFNWAGGIRMEYGFY